MNIIPFLTLRNISSSRIRLICQPAMYVLNNKLQRAKAMNLIEEFGDDLKNISGKCMDVGCGPGDVTKEIILPALHSNAVAIGTDISQNMIEYGNRTYSIKKRLEFEVLDIQTKNLPTKYISEFDFISAIHVLHWCTDIRQAFENIYRMLRPNGTILLYLVASHDISEVLRILAQDIRFVQYIPDKMTNFFPYHGSNNARKELKELLQNIGFRVHHCSLRESSYTEKKSKQFLTDSVMSVLTFLEDMQEDLKKEYKNALRSEYMKRKVIYKSIYNNQELILDLYKMLVVYGQKI